MTRTGLDPWFPGDVAFGESAPHQPAEIRQLREQSLGKVSSNTEVGRKEAVWFRRNGMEAQMGLARGLLRCKVSH